MNVRRCTTFAFCTAVAAAVAAGPLLAQTIQVNKENRTIAITATDKVTVLADTASVHIGFIAYGPDNDTAYANGSKISNGIVKALKGSGIADDAIESENQNVSPVQDYQVDKLTPAEKAQRKFQVTQSWTVRVPANDAAKALDVAVKAGANQSGQIDWSLKDDNASDAEAAGKALQRARTQAVEMAKGLNATLGALLYASNEAQAAAPRPLMRAMAAPVGGAMMKAEPLAINARQIEKSATVYAVFAIE
jgi:uncharacterized protein YggE